MSNRVYTYTKITELKKAPFFSEIAALPQLTMSLEVAKSMAFDMRIFRRNIMGFSSFQQRLFPGWNTSGQRFAYVTTLNHFLRDKISSAKDKSERDWLFGCKKNLFLAISNIIRLEESGVRPEDMPDTDRDMLLFVEMWKKLENADDSICNFRNRLLELQDAETFHETVNHIFKFHGKKQIVWNGFQFLTPIQQYVFDRFQQTGYDIFALIQDEERYPYANEIWDHLYDAKNGFPEKNRWIRQRSDIRKNPLGEIFETGEKNSAPGIKIIRYKNTIEFIEDVPRIKEAGYYLYCADDKAANQLLKDYFPERYEVRNLLSYPIGQFVYTLHRMWDENLQCIVLSQNGLRKCFASGWLSSNGKSSLNFTDDLERLLPYFDGCYTVEEWEDRLDTFIEACENAVDVFKVRSADPDDRRKKELFGDPFQYFSVFSIKESHMDDVVGMISRLIKMAKTLFGKNEPVSIQEHMNKLDSMLYMNEGMPKELYLEEREKVNCIFEALENEKIKDFLCYPGDLAAALLSFMSDRPEEEQDPGGLKTLVFHLFQVEAAPIAAKEKVHICLADISRLPGAAGKYGWPLDEAVLLSVVERNKKTYLNHWIENNRLTALSNRYYIYTALKNEDVEISWIQKQGEKLYSPSPYLTLLDKLTDVHIQEKTVRSLDFSHVAGIHPKRHLDGAFDIYENKKQQGYDPELVYALCPMRFVYEYVLGNGPTYRSEYQQNRAIVRFIQVLSKLLEDKYTIEQIAEQVFEIFPNIRKAEKRQMMDDAIRWSLPENEDAYTRYGEKDYTNHRWNLTVLDGRSYEQARENAAMLMSREGRKGIFYDRGLQTGTRNCEFCPHSGYCMHALYGVDYKGEQE